MLVENLEIEGYRWPEEVWTQFSASLERKYDEVTWSLSPYNQGEGAMQSRVLSGGNWHFAGVVNWNSFSEEHRRTYKTLYLIFRCIQCNFMYKDCEGYWGSGQRGKLQEFYSENDFAAWI